MPAPSLPTWTPDTAFSGLLATPGLVWLALALLVSGLIRGFAGFGRALVFMPIASRFLPMQVDIEVLVMVDVLSLPLIVPGAWRAGHRRDVGLLIVAALLTTPLGVLALTHVGQDALRWGVAIAASIALAALIGGWRYRGRVGKAVLSAVGGIGGFLGGSVGIGGPPVTLFYLAIGKGSVAATRANTILFVAALDVMVTLNLAIRGLITGEALLLGALLAVPYLAGVALGVRLFHPGRNTSYRLIAYIIIAGAVIFGLPIFH